MRVVRAKGPKRILRLLLIKDENLFYDVMQTLRLFLAGGEDNEVISAAGAVKESNDGITYDAESAASSLPQPKVASGASSSIFTQKVWIRLGDMVAQMLATKLLSKPPLSKHATSQLESHIILCLTLSVRALRKHAAYSSGS